MEKETRRITINVKLWEKIVMEILPFLSFFRKLSVDDNRFSTCNDLIKILFIKNFITFVTFSPNHKFPNPQQNIQNLSKLNFFSSENQNYTQKT